MFHELMYLPRPIVFVFGGGGSRGAAQAGQMKAVAETGLRPDAVIGTSVGSISAAVVAENPSEAATKLVDVWQLMKKTDAFPGSLLAQAARLTQTGTHLFTQDALRKTLKTHLDVDTIADLAIPYAAVTTDFKAAQPNVIFDGSLHEAIVASAAIPGVFPMVEIDGRQMCDGGVVANVPVIEARLYKPGSLVVFDCIGPVDTTGDDIVDIVAGAAGIMMHKQRVADLAAVAKDLPIVYLPPPRSAGSPLNFSHTQELIDDTYETSRTFLADLHLDPNPPPGLYGTIPTALAPDQEAPAQTSLPEVALKALSASALSTAKKAVGLDDSKPDKENDTPKEEASSSPPTT